MKVTPRIAAPALVAMLALAGCSVSVGDKTISKSELEQQAAAALAQQQGIAEDQVPKITCPDDLKAKVGETTTCTMGNAAEAPRDVSIEVTKVDDSSGKASFTVTLAPDGAAQDESQGDTQDAGSESDTTE